MLRKQVECADGFRVSIQASSGHYCSPRVSNAPSYTHVELGFPSQKPPDYICPFIDWWGGDEPDYIRSVYAQVPAYLVSRMLDEHGGVVGGELPPLSVNGDEYPEEYCESCGGYCEGQCEYCEEQCEYESAPPDSSSVFLVQRYDLYAFNKGVTTLGLASTEAKARELALRYIEQCPFGFPKLVPRDFSGESETGHTEFIYVDEVSMNSLLSRA
jgi:hypothetical protein